MRWEITRSTEDTAGELFEATNWIDPRMPGPPVHVHPTAKESYEVIEGALEVFMNGEWSPVRAGEKATVPAGVSQDQAPPAKGAPFRHLRSHAVRQVPGRDFARPSRRMGSSRPWPSRAGHSASSSKPDSCAVTTAASQCTPRPIGSVVTCTQCRRWSDQRAARRLSP